MKAIIALLVCAGLVFGLAMWQKSSEQEAEPANIAAASEEIAVPVTTEETITPTEPPVELQTVYRLLTDTWEVEDRVYRQEFHYDENGIAQEIVSYSGDQEIMRTIPVCDEAGNIISKTYFNNDTSSTYTYTYDENNQELSCVQTDAEGELIASSHKTVNEFGNVVSMVVLNPIPDSDGNKIMKEYRYVNSYDENNYLVRQDLYEDNVLTQYYLMNNDEDGMTVDQTGYYADGSLMNIIERTWESELVEVRTLKTANDEITSTITMTYDENGNLVELLTVTDTYTTKQTMTYQAFEVPVR